MARIRSQSECSATEKMRQHELAGGKIEINWNFYCHRTATSKKTLTISRIELHCTRMFALCSPPMLCDDVIVCRNKSARYTWDDRNSFQFDGFSMVNGIHCFDVFHGSFCSLRLWRQQSMNPWHKAYIKLSPQRYCCSHVHWVNVRRSI